MISQIVSQLKELFRRVERLERWESGSGGLGGDMTKAVYDTNLDNIVDSAEEVDGVGAAGNDKYYGTDGVGTAGFHNLPVGGDMFKATYDTDANNIVDSAEEVDGVSSAGNDKYYGTDGGGTAGFHSMPSPGVGGFGDMLKAVYDTDDNGIVDNSEKVDGVDTAGNSKYYGTDTGGTPGFHSFDDLMAGSAEGQILYFDGSNWIVTQPVLDNGTWVGDNGILVVDTP